MKRLASTGQTDYALKTGSEEVYFTLGSSYEARISDSTRSSLREALRVIKEQLLRGKRDETYRLEERRRQAENLRKQEERKARLDETHRREEERGRRMMHIDNN